MAPSVTSSALRFLSACTSRSTARGPTLSLRRRPVGHTPSLGVSGCDDSLILRACLRCRSASRPKCVATRPWLTRCSMS
eukprot:scaffold203490_cov30-Tisochrysis_lutea.AAC.2